MRAGFEVDVKCSAISFCPSVLEGADFGVLHSVVGVSARANDVAANVYYHGTYVRIGRGQSDTLPRKVESPEQKLFVSGLVGH